MATTSEMGSGVLSLVIVEIFLVAMAYLGMQIMAPLIDIIDRTGITPLLGFSDTMSWVLPAYWMILVIIGIAAMVAFFYIAHRRQSYYQEYEGL